MIKAVLPWDDYIRLIVDKELGRFFGVWTEDNVQWYYSSNTHMSDKMFSSKEEAKNACDEFLKKEGYLFFTHEQYNKYKILF